MTLSNTEKPSILFIDDEPDLIGPQVYQYLEGHAANATKHPQDVEMTDLITADIVLVDYRLDHWPERDKLPIISLKPTSGMALAVLLREKVDQHEISNKTAFAINTAHLVDIQGRFSTETAQHVLARLNNLEWIFRKLDPNCYTQTLLLAKATQQLPNRWPIDTEETTTVVRRLLAMNESDLSFERCWQDVKSCRIPVDVLTTGNHGILFLRWLLHQVLPYPCFLWEKHWVAARLGISLLALEEVLEGDSDLSNDLNKMQYTGVLSGFLGDRWWRGAVEDFVWEQAGGRTADSLVLHEALNRRAGMDLNFINDSPALVSLDAKLLPTGQFLSPRNAVTLCPDHWPSFADSAWMDIETVRSDTILQSMVDPLDAHRVTINEE